ncbi:hypothetical protein AB0L05_26555 [Nonomuraea pusilla]|uniref:NACHT domain-containing protein n=1 Tax=Nonomuraea pusilla TaxID=46177 RepID=UPI00332E7914
MIETLSYADALRVLGCKDARLTKVVRFASAAERTGWALAGGAGLGTSLADLRDAVVRHGGELAGRLPELRDGDRFTRTRRLAAAHAVVVVSAYFEALGESALPFTLERLDHGGGGRSTAVPVAERFAALVSRLLLERLPAPEPHRTHAETRADVERAYLRMSEAVAGYAGGMAVWDELTVEDQLLLPRLLAEGPPARAVRLYDEGYRALALDSHEFGVRDLVTEEQPPGTGLSRVAWLLAELAPPRLGDAPVVHRVRMAASGLDRPLLPGDEPPGDVVLPLLGEGYVRPRCRVAALARDSAPADPGWWAEQRPLPDVEAFLAGHLTSLRATQEPLLVLGEPGSGKSTLTEVLAARLARSEFLPVRVELSRVPPDAPVTEQIESALRAVLGEELRWPGLVEAAGGALPVVLIDGLDELLQGSRTRYDYLERVREFQAAEAALGRPVAAVVTSRTVVADRIRCPEGLVALQLQPFDDDQVRQWLDIWDQTNRAPLARRDLKPLPADVALAQGELARRPLLLMLLALYDAAGNALQREPAPIGRARLYETLIGHHTDGEPLRQAAAALALFARGRQVAPEEELARDVAALCGEGGPPGGFFLVRRGGLGFLHATFGEFLVAWLTVYALRDLDRRHRLAAAEPLALGQGVDDDLLHAVTSFSCLAERGPAVGFTLELLDDLPPAVRARCLTLLTGLLRESLHGRRRRAFTAFEPVRHTVTRRLAAYSANLTLLALGVAGRPVAVSRLLPGLEEWASLTHLWKGHLGREGWTGLVAALSARRVAEGGGEDVVLGSGEGDGMGDVVAVATGRAPRQRRLLDLLLRSLAEGRDLPYHERVALLGELLRAGAASPAAHRALAALWTREGADRAALRPLLRLLLSDPAERAATWEDLLRAGMREEDLWEADQGAD